MPVITCSGRIQFLPRDLLAPRPLVISDMLCKGRRPKWSSVDRGAKLVDGGGVLSTHIEGLAVPLWNRTCSLTQNRICGCPPVAAEEGTRPGAFGVKSLQLSLQRVNPEAVGAGPSACTPVMSQGLEHSGPLALCNSPFPPPHTETLPYLVWHQHAREESCCCWPWLQSQCYQCHCNFDGTLFTRGFGLDAAA